MQSPDDAVQATQHGTQRLVSDAVTTLKTLRDRIINHTLAFDWRGQKPAQTHINRHQSRSSSIKQFRITVKSSIIEISITSINLNIYMQNDNRIDVDESNKIFKFNLFFSIKCGNQLNSSLCSGSLVLPASISAPIE